MTRRPVFLDAVLELGRELGPGDVVVVEVRHDEGCAHWRGEECDCDFELRGPASAEGVRAVDASAADLDSSQSAPARSGKAQGK